MGIIVREFDYKGMKGRLFKTSKDLIYNELKEKIGESLNFIPRKIPDYTDHGIEHVKRMQEILDVLSNFIRQISTPGHLTDFEYQALKFAILFHDIGNLHCRTFHNFHSCELLLGKKTYISGGLTTNTIKSVNEQLRIYGLNNLDFDVSWSEEDISGLTEREMNFISLIAELCKYHKLSTKYLDMEDKLLELCKNEGNLFRKLSCILRICDNLDLSQQRTPGLIYEMMKTEMDCESKIIWEAHKIMKPPEILVSDDEKHVLIVIRIEEFFEREENIKKYIQNIINRYREEITIGTCKQARRTDLIEFAELVDTHIIMSFSSHGRKKEIIEYFYTNKALKNTEIESLL
ncbi:MAG: hypothetical protein ACFFB5_13915 [Promethearchaeota archaeon]